MSDIFNIVYFNNFVSYRTLLNQDKPKIPGPVLIDIFFQTISIIIKPEMVYCVYTGTLISSLNFLAIKRS